MNQELDRYFHHVYRNTRASFIPDTIPEFRSKAEVDAWFHELERKDVLYAEYLRNLKELEKKEQEAIDNMVNAAKDSLNEIHLDKTFIEEDCCTDITLHELISDNEEAL
jgi:dsDNA-binding SOS-regulon protein